MKTQSPTFFDIETAALPESDIEPFMPEFSAPKGWVDPEKIKANIAAHRSEWLQGAALSPITGHILCIGVIMPNGDTGVIEGQERDILLQFWDVARTCMFSNTQMVGWAIFHFDLPFIVKRSYRHEVPLPMLLRHGPAQRYWHDSFLDLQEQWKMGDNRAECSLDTVARFLGLGAKNGDGSKFGEMWRADKPKALEYVRNDLALTKAIWERTQPTL